MAKQATHEREDRVLDDLCEQLAQREGVPVCVVGRPDREERRVAAVDALVQRGSVLWAVEHTRVFDRPNHLGLHERLAPFKAIIESAVMAAFPHDLVAVALPVEELPDGHRGEQLARMIAAAVIREVPGTPKGKARLFAVEGLATAIGLWRQACGLKEGACDVGALAPENGRELRAKDLLRALTDKRPKVDAARGNGFRTMLVLDAELLGDQALEVALLDVGSTEHLDPYDEIYIAVPTYQPTMFVMLKSGERWPLDEPEREEFMELWRWAHQKPRTGR